MSVVSDNIEKIEENEDKSTNWRSIIITGILLLQMQIATYICAISALPYLKEIDNSASSQFYGWINAVGPIGNAVFAPIFAVFNHRYQSYRGCVIVGEFIAILGSILYMLIEFFPHNRRYVMLTCFLINGISNSCNTVLRAYMVVTSSEKNRTAAFAVVAGAQLLSTICGPLIQLAFSPLGYPGKTVIKNKLYFNIYSSGAWMATIFNFIGIFIAIFLFRNPEKKCGEKSRMYEDDWSWSGLKEKFSEVLRMDVSWPLITLLCCERMAVFLQSAANQTLFPIAVMMDGWNGEKTVIATSVGMGSVGLLALFAIIIVGVMKTKAPSRILFLVGLAATLIAVVVSYPYPFSTKKLKPYNETQHTGCDPSEYSWCDKGRVSNPYVLLPAIVTASVMMPVEIIAIDSIYSKLLEKFDQNVFQCFMVIAEDLMNIIGPIYVSGVFTAVGQWLVWVINFTILCIAGVVWLISYKTLGRYS